LLQGRRQLDRQRLVVSRMRTLTMGKQYSIRPGCERWLRRGAAKPDSGGRGRSRRDGRRRETARRAHNSAV
jgi:hypothetical protein